MTPIPVCAAIIQYDDKVLLCQRKNGALAEKWEFPGGKIEPGESPEECLLREISEELDITITVDRIFEAVNARYEHGCFLLLGYLAHYQGGTINLQVHQGYAWVETWRLLDYDLAAANIPMAQKLVEQANAARTSMGSNGRSY